MKNRVFLFVILFICFFGFTTKVDAIEYHSPEEYLCGKKNMNELLSRIRNVKTNYELMSKEDGGKYFKIKVSNFQPDLVVNIYGMNYTYEQNGKEFYILNTIPITGGDVAIEFYGGMNHPCAEQYISKRTLKVPKYNIYSELDSCVEYEEFPLCAKYYDGEINNATEFNEKLNEWIRENTVEKEEITQSLWEKIQEFLGDNQLEVAIIIILIILLIIAIIVRKIIRRVKRTKIKFKS
jgi:hypothetical protein